MDEFYTHLPNEDEFLEDILEGIDLPEVPELENHSPEIQLAKKQYKEELNEQAA